MANKKIDIDKYALGLFVRTEQYADKVRQHYVTAIEELLKISPKSNISPDKLFSFSDNRKLSEKANQILRGLYSAVYNEIKNGVIAEWEYANLSCDALIESVFGKGLEEDNHYARWFSRNQEAMTAFFARKSIYGGLNLSQKVWKYTGDLKTEMELALSLALGQGDSASTVSRKVRQYLQEPNKLFRRIRIGTDANGNPLYKLSKAAKAYHPGRGVYRSSYKNAMRLTRTEINMAYRASEQDRWQRMDFVVGYEVKRSNHSFDCSLCESLKGKYPKDFVFNGWHPQCRCFVVPILSTEDEFLKMQEKILSGESPSSIRSVNTIRRPHENFYNWWEENKERVETATTMPYWVQDNQDYINKKRKIRVRTDEEREAIRKKWAERSKKYQLITKMANNVLKVAQEYPEINLISLQSFIDKRNIVQMNNEARTVAKQIVEIRKDEKMLSALIPDVHEWKKQFTSAELHDVYDAVENKIASWSSLSLEKQAEKLKFEWDDFLGGNMKNVQLKYKTWQVSQAAYKRKYEQVLDSIDWQNIDNVLHEALTFKTKSKPYLDLIDKLQVSISAGDKTKAQSIVTDMQAKRAALKRAADARAVKRYGKSADGLYAGGNPFEAGELAKLKDYETRIIDGIMSGRGADHNLIAQYHDYVLQLSEKYYQKQASLFTDEERNAMKAIADKYLARPKTNPHWIWGTDLGGVYSDIDSKVNAYLPKLAGLTREELSIVQRFTNGSTFSNCYNLRNESEYWRNKFKDKLSSLSRAEIKEQYEIIEEWSQGANYTLDRMVRYNGITFRGVDSGGGPELRKALSQAFKKNKPWVNNASCSTSMKHRVAESFDGDTILIIHNKTGAYIHAISDYSSEYEIMTLRGTKYKVLAPPKRIGSRYYVELEEII